MRFVYNSLLSLVWPYNDSVSPNLVPKTRTWVTWVCRSSTNRPLTWHPSLFDVFAVAARSGETRWRPSCRSGLGRFFCWWSFLRAGFSPFFWFEFEPLIAEDGKRRKEEISCTKTKEKQEKTKQKIEYEPFARPVWSHVWHKNKRTPPPLTNDIRQNSLK